MGLVSGGDLGKECPKTSTRSQSWRDAGRWLLFLCTCVRRGILGNASHEMRGGAMLEAKTIKTGRRPEIAGTRITVYESSNITRRDGTATRSQPFLA